MLSGSGPVPNDTGWKLTAPNNRSWTRTPTCYAPIKDATSAIYTPVETDATASNNGGMYLKATATYTDPQGSDTAEKSSVSPVQIDARNRPPKFPDQDDETAGDQLDQEREVAENIGRRTCACKCRQHSRRFC